MKSEYIDGELWRGIVSGMTPANALAIAVSLETGLRIGDVLRLHESDLCEDGISYTAEKTGKSGAAKCSAKIIRALHENAINGVCFPSRTGAKGKYRTRQAVWKNVRRAACNAGIKPHVSPHSARKTFAVELRRRSGIGAVQEALQHRYAATTNLYAFADVQGAEYNREAIVNEAAAKVLERLGALLGIDLSEPKTPEPLDIFGEDELQ